MFYNFVLFYQSSIANLYKSSQTRSYGLSFSFIYSSNREFLNVTLSWFSKVNPDFRTHIRSFLHKLDGLAKNKFLKSATEFLSISREYLFNRLPLENNIVRTARFCQAALRQCNYTPKAMGKLAFSVGKVLGKDGTRNVFIQKVIKTGYDLVTQLSVKR